MAQPIPTVSHDFPHLPSSANKKRLALFSLIGLLLIGIFTVAMLVDFMRIKEVEPAVISNDHPVQWQLDAIAHGDAFITLSGWALIPGETPRQFASHVILENLQNGRRLRIPMMLMARDELNEQFSDGIDYTQSGFLAKVARRFIFSDGNSWKILLEYKNNGHAYLLDLQQVIEVTQ